MSEKKGIIVGADRKIEWLLTFWWSHYQAHNHLPVTFIDFGLSAKGRAFCEKRGNLVPLSQQIAINRKGKIEKQRAAEWEKSQTKAIWKQRQSWFKKPFALLQTPYERTLWLDLDCEVLGPLEPMLDFCIPHVALAQETEQAQLFEKKEGRLLENEILYNSGVIVYQKEAPLIQKWAESVLRENGEFWGDQHLLSRIIHLEPFTITELPPEYNWRMSQGMNFNALIIHWLGSWGKAYIRKHGGLSHELAKLTKIN